MLKAATAAVALMFAASAYAAPSIAKTATNCCCPHCCHHSK